jgi:sigma-B regulation protein RsbU (phosphoserine phosphatase)
MVACVQIFAGIGGKIVYETEKPLLTTLCAHAAVCLTNARNYIDLAEKARIEGEIAAGRSIQQSLTPDFKPDIPHVNLKGHYVPASEVGGDYLDYFQNDTGQWVAVIADVCGKGIPAALLMTELRSAFRIEARQRSSARDIICAVNDTIMRTLDTKSFITALCLVIEADGSSMTYARAGHPHLLHREKNGLTRSIACSGVCFGLVSDVTQFASLSEEIKIPLVNGDQFFVYTDGLTESLGPDGEAYGTSRLMSFIDHNISPEPEGLLNGLLKDVHHYMRNEPFTDDLTLLSIMIV